MSGSKIQEDLQHLAGRLIHRGASTEDERSAAEYIRDRFKQYTADIEIDDFYCIDSPQFLFAMYYSEFMVVAFIAIWWPRMALCYGSAILLAYLAEFMGYEIMGRFAPQFETQNVVARFMAPTPVRLLVVMAHYDSRRTGPLSEIWDPWWVRPAHASILFCMVIVILTCAIQSVTIPDENSDLVTTLLSWATASRWIAAVCLLGAAFVMAIDARAGDFARGANDNASGTAALLKLAECFSQNPIPDADVYLVATGGNQAWMSGARHLINTHKFDQENTRFLNLDEVGSANLCYTASEGLLYAFPAGNELLKTAEALAPKFDAHPIYRPSASSDALIAHTHAYQTITLTSLATEESDNPHDTLVDVDASSVEHAANFAEAILRATTTQPNSAVSHRAPLVPETEIPPHSAINGRRL